MRPLLGLPLCVLALAVLQGCAISLIPADAPSDAGPRDVPVHDVSTTQGCHSRDDCAPREVCVFNGPGCPRDDVTGTCVTDSPCTEFQSYCGCDGMSYSTCLIEHPFRAFGTCAMPVPDASRPLPPCVSDADCPLSAFCSFSAPACGAMGLCRDVNSCDTPMSRQFCGCDGRTFAETNNCTHRPYTHEGVCENAGTGECRGAQLGSDGLCHGTDDSVVAIECCYGYDCETTCASAPQPECPAGSTASWAPSVYCWTGQCVPDSHCGIIHCDPSTGCRRGWHCVINTCQLDE